MKLKIKGEDDILNLGIEDSFNLFENLRRVKREIEELLQVDIVDMIWKNLDKIPNKDLMKSEYTTSLDACLYLINSLKLPKDFTQEVYNMTLDLDCKYLVYGGYTMLEKWCNIRSGYKNNIYHIRLAQIYDVLVSGIKKTFILNGEHLNIRNPKIIGCNNNDGWGSCVPIYDKEGW